MRKDFNRHLYTLIEGGLDGAGLMSRTEALWKAEHGQRHSNYKKSAREAAGLLEEKGLEEVERLPFPADGRTVYQDKTMPFCWEASEGKLIVKKSPLAFADPVVADIDRHPFHLIKGSSSSPPGGVTARLTTSERMFGGEDVRGAVVMAEPGSREKSGLYGLLCDNGALAMVCDWLGTRYETPDSIPWVNGWTEGPNWHTTARDRPLMGFSVSPRTGDMLRNAASRGEVLVRAASDGRNFEGEIDVVTGVVPGRDRKRELWLLAHLYEPLSTDNSTGVVSAAEIAGSIRNLVREGVLPRPELTIRVVLGLEMYGFAAYAHSRGGYLRESVAGAINLDGIAVSAGRRVDAVLAPPPTGFIGNHTAEELVEDLGGVFPAGMTVRESGGYHDDLFLNDSTIGVPTVWFRQERGLWHNSAQTMEIIERDVFKKYTAFAACWVYRTAGPYGRDLAERAVSASAEKIRAETESRREANESGGKRGAGPGFPESAAGFRYAREEKIIRNAGLLSGRPELAREKASWLADLSGARACIPAGAGRSAPEDPGPHRKAAAAMVPRRAAAGLPHDIAAAPAGRARTLPGILERVLSNMDGKKNLAELVEEAQWEENLGLPPGNRPGRDETEREMRRCAGAVEYLAGMGLVQVEYDFTISRSDIAAALEAAGVGPGGVVFVHSALSVFGHIDGGAKTVAEAFLDVLGKEGTLLMPAFNRSFIYFEGMPAADKRPRPFQANDPGLIYTGSVPAAFLRMGRTCRSIHPSHSTAGAGRLAQDLLSGHRESDSPCGRTSPLARLLEYEGKLVWFGADLSSTTFFHFLEDETDMPYLAAAVCLVRNPDGRLRSVLTPKNLPGHRDFYQRPGEDSKMYVKLFGRGLEMKSRPLGFGSVRTADVRRMYELGLEALGEDPALMLCDDSDCVFCRNAKSALGGS